MRKMKNKLCRHGQDDGSPEEDRLETEESSFFSDNSEEIMNNYNHTDSDDKASIDIDYQTQDPNIDNK